MTHIKSRVRPTSPANLVQSTQFAAQLARWLIIGLFFSIVAMMFLPWQQTSRGNGQVIAYAPQERQQTIQAQTKGVVVRIRPGLAEGTKVKKGDFLLELQPFSPNKVQQLNGQLQELKNKLISLEFKAEAYQRNIEGFEDAGTFAVNSAKQLVEAAIAKLDAKQKSIAGYEAKELQARLNFERQNSLFESGIKPAKEIEKLKKEWDVAIAELEMTREEVKSLEMELAAKREELNEKRELAKTKVDYARALKQEAIGNQATIKKEIREVQIKLDETKRLVIEAPRDGTIYRMPVYERGQTIKEGQSILTLVPETTQKAVELFINGNDLPMIRVGQEVRLQFEGWPAIQLAGWPSMAIGTFTGTVANIDATDDGKGRFRILVLPIYDSNDPDLDTAWPEDQFLRQGVRANGWVNMKRVTLGFEFWRQLNGFPVILDEKPKTEKSKPPKLLK